MIHYGTPITGPEHFACEFLRGRHALVSFANPRDLSTALDVCQSVVLDNGAFTHWKAGNGEVDVQAYHEWVHTVQGHPSLDWCLIPDSIDGGQERNIDLVNLWLRMGSAGVNGGALNRYGMYPHPKASGRAVNIAAIIESQNSCPVWISQGEQHGFFG